MLVKASTTIRLNDKEIDRVSTSNMVFDVETYIRSAHKRDRPQSKNPAKAGFFIDLPEHAGCCESWLRLELPSGV